MTTLTMYHIIAARIDAGAVVYKATEFVTDKEKIYGITGYRYTDHKFFWYYIMHPDLIDSFIDEMTKQGHDVIPFDEYIEAEREFLRIKAALA